MSTPVALGWIVRNAFVEGFGSGRLVVAGPHTWSINADWSYSALATAYAEAFVIAAFDWLVGAHSGLAIAIAAADPTPNTSHFGPNFQSYVSGLGNTITLSGSGANWGTLTLADYDLLIMHDCQTTEVRDQVDEYLDNTEGSLLGTLAPGAWARYGISNAGIYSVGVDRCTRFNCAPFGADEYGLYAYSNAAMASGTKTRPGTTTLYSNGGGVPVIALWENP